MKSYTIILLAAGSSSRFGSPKQLAQFNGLSLIRHAILESLKVISDVIVVLGANFTIIKKEIEHLPLQIEYNEDWEKGMASSIHCGMKALINKNPYAEAVIIVVCDQPFLSSTIIFELIKKYETTKKTIIACFYDDGTAGTPALFDKTFFNDLLSLEGQSGAKKIIAQNEKLIETISFPPGSIDIDTKEDYESFQNMTKN